MRIASVDVGGTFTDVVYLDSGEIKVYKGPTTPRNPEIGVMEGLKRFDPADLVVHATTIATNSLLGQVNLELPKVALITTKGFRDVIEIGRQNRPELYNPFFTKPNPLVPRELRFEVTERVGPRGEELRALNEAEVESAVREAKKLGATSLAISFLHSYLNPSHERRAKEIASEHFKYVSVSHEVSPTPREYERTSTTVINAMLMPVVTNYLSTLREKINERGNPSLLVMSSSGGLVDVREASERPVQVIESGPAAGAVGASLFSRTLKTNVIAFDMGGTTAKASSIVNGEVSITLEYEVGGRTHYGRLVKGTGYPIRFPFLDLVEVSAGGGSIIWEDQGGALRVGPLSAGAEPGPMCYGKGGSSPTLTDASLVLGWINDVLAGGLKLRKDLAEKGLSSLGDKHEVALKATSLATLEMARAIRLVTVERGLDPSEFALFSFGGAGPQYAFKLAEEIGISRVVVPPHPGLFSALGMMLADIKVEESMSYPRDLDQAFLELEDRVRRRLPGASFVRQADVRYEGQGWELTVPVGDVKKVREAFEELHQRTYGFKLDREVEVVTIRVFGVVEGMRVKLTHFPSGTPHPGEREVLMDHWVKAKVYRREELPVGFEVEGPSIVEEYSSTTLVGEGWRAKVDESGSLVMVRE